LCFLGYKYFIENKKQVKGTWVRSVDYTDDVNLEMSKWICSASLGNEIDITEYTGETKVNIIMNFNDDGTYEELVDKSSYDEAVSSIGKACHQALSALIEKRLAEVNISGDIDPDSLMQTAYGLSLDDYIGMTAPAFIPEYEDINNEYKSSGDYVTEDGLLYMGRGTKEELLLLEGYPYIVGDMLVILDNDNDARIYRKPEKKDKKSKDDDEASAAIGKLLEEIDDTFNMKVQAASYSYPYAMTAKNAETGKELTLAAYQVEYSGNLYLSLRDLAGLLSGTDKAYDMAFTEEGISIRTGKDYISSGGENMGFPEECDELGYKINTNTASKEVKFNDVTRKYYLLTAENAEKNKDAYMSMLDLSMLFDMKIELDGDNLIVYPNKKLVLDLETMEDNSEYFDMSKSALVGDATNGDIFYSFHEDEEVPIASTTKLMTYIVVMDAVYNGEIATTDTLNASDNVVALSMTADRVIPMEEGQTASFDDVIKGMLMGSSNECSLMLAEHVAGSEEAFVERMNAKATEIGLSDATLFYNCNGLPVYSDNVYNAKNQNHMTASDMFLLCRYLLSLYPEITDITSLAKVELSSFKNQEIKNTNPILYNIDGMMGLKTGTTAMSGACLIGACKTEDDHVLVSVLFGAESSILRAQMSEVLMRYGLQEYSNTGGGGNLVNAPDVPDNLEGLIRNLINVARKQKSANK